MTSDTIYDIVTWSIACFAVVLGFCAIAAAIGLTIWFYKWLINKWKPLKTDDSKEKPGHNHRFADNYIAHVFIIVAVIAVIFIGLAIMAKYLWQFEIENSDIVLTFVGVLATFIVVTNYAQVLEIKKEVNNRISSIEGWKSRMSDRITHPDKYVKDEHISSKSQRSRIRSVRPKHKE